MPGTASRHRLPIPGTASGADRIALLVSFEATVAVDLPNGWKAGQRISLKGSSFFHLQGQRIVRLVDLS
jgi:hypothetical protein